MRPLSFVSRPRRKGPPRVMVARSIYKWNYTTIPQRSLGSTEIDQKQLQVLASKDYYPKKKLVDTTNRLVRRNRIFSRLPSSARQCSPVRRRKWLRRPGRQRRRCWSVARCWRRPRLPNDERQAHRVSSSFRTEGPPERWHWSLISSKNIYLLNITGSDLVSEIDAVDGTADVEVLAEPHRAHEPLCGF